MDDMWQTFNDIKTSIDTHDESNNLLDKYQNITDSFNLNESIDISDNVGMKIKISVTKEKSCNKSKQVNESNQTRCYNCNSEDLIYEETVTCTNCGTINNDLIDSSQEWRFYGADDNKNSSDPTRCGMPMNPLLPNSSLGTMINGHGNEMFRKLHKWNAISYKERSLIKVFNKIIAKGELGTIPSCILDKASVMYKMLSENSIKRGSSRESLIAACIWHALKAKDETRSTREIAKLFNLSIKKMTTGCKEFNEKMYNKNKTYINNIKATKSHDYINRNSIKIKLESKYIEMAKHIANMIDMIGIVNQNTPQSIAIGCIFLISEKYKLGYTKKILHNLCDTSEVTISKTYKELVKYSKYLFINDSN